MALLGQCSPAGFFLLLTVQAYVPPVAACRSKLSPSCAGCDTDRPCHEAVDVGAVSSAYVTAQHQPVWQTICVMVGGDDLRMAIFSYLSSRHHPSY